MSVLSQGTQVFFIDPVGGAVVEIVDATTFNPGSSPKDQIEVTPLAERKEKRFKKGLRTPGQAALGLNADPQIAAHTRLYELYDSDEDVTLKFVVGWSDGESAPTVTDGNFTLPATRTWFEFFGYVSDFPFDHAANSVVATALTIQRTGGARGWVKKVNG
ncbi:phage tail tube protein [Alishewanella sp. d11]|uniref:phage tail tube protein n=1 Tax=Alishewanella sp. d11 TaxID=3414030 RepID=UPI003BF8FF86